MAPTYTRPVGVPHDGPAHVTTSYLLGNLHCPSCVSSIKHALHETCGPDVLWVSPNIVTSVVTVEHTLTERTSALKMTRALEDAGFEVEAVTSSGTDDEQRKELDRELEAHAGEPDRDAEEGRSTVGGWLWSRGTRASGHIRLNSTHIANCDQCRREKRNPSGVDGAGDGPGLGEDLEKGTSVSLTASPTSARPSVAELESVGVAGDAPTWRATYAVGGMTCAVCVNTISDELNKVPWISNVAVNLVSNSATIDFVEEGRADDIVEAIEDLGYEATLDKVVSLDKKQEGGVDERTVEIRVDGLFCPHCSGRLTHSLEGFQRSLKVLTPATMESPIVKLSYVPDAPIFTIRHILDAIEAADPSFKASIFHPPTLEERSKQIRRRHQMQIIQRLVITVIVAIPTFVLGIVYMSLMPHTDPVAHYLMKPWTSGLSRMQVSLCILATVVYFFGADLFHVRSYKEVRTMWKRGSKTPIIKRFTNFGSMNMLISLGTTVAYFSSLIQMIYAAAAKPDHFADKDVYFDTVVFLTMFILAGRLIESYSKSKTGDAVDLLRKLKPNTAVLVEKTKETENDVVVDVDKLEIGDLVRVPNGASPPGDGVVVKGDSKFDESSLTGEARLVPKALGAEVFAGTVNKNSPVMIRITGVGGTSMLDQIVNIVQEGQTKRAPMEQIADLMTSYFVPVITLFAIITWVVWIAVGYAGAVPDDVQNEDGSWVAFALQFSIAVFVVACPCGLALAAPTAIFVGGGIAAKHGILAKGGGEAFEKASKIGCVVFDKTGTLTRGGEPTITDVAIYPDVDEVKDEDALQLLAALKAVEDNSSHPIARAISSYCASRTTASVSVDDLQEIPGKGMKATYHTGDAEQFWEILVGNEGLMGDYEVPISERASQLLQTWSNEAKSIAVAAIKQPGETSWRLGAALSISDNIRPEAIPIIRMLKESGRQVWMISGDNPSTARAVARLVGIDEANVIAGVLPSEKSDKIAYLQKTLKEAGSTTRRALVAMVGDGINDSPALTLADVGIAIGSGSDVAISSADFVLVKSDLRAVLTLLDLSRAVFRRIMFNFGWAVVFNVCAIPIAAGVLFPVRTGGGRVKLDPAWAALAMALSSVSVVLSSLALRWGVWGIGFRVKEVKVEGVKDGDGV